MIQTHIHLPKSSYLFKTLKKKKLLGNDIRESLFIWIDDGKNELKNVQLKNTTTGEVTNVKPKKK